MGYTHHWEGFPTAEAYGKTALDAKAIVQHARTIGISICGSLGEGEPQFTEGYVALNGDESKDEAYESFILNPNDGGSFCKTERRPYDAVVTALLIRFAKYGGEVSSDGEWDDWEAGREIVKAVFGEDPECPFRD